MFGVSPHAMKTLSLFLLMCGLALVVHAADSIENSWFLYVDGIFAKGEFIDLNTNATERLWIRYSPIADRGVELERTTNSVVVWRVHVQPLGIEHSRYRHDVTVRIQDDRILVTSVGAQQIFEVHSLKTGALVSRKIEEVQKQRY
jgi:hypothetical protein